MRVQGMTARAELVCYFKVILPHARILLSLLHTIACRRTVSVTSMTPSRYRRPLMICAAAVALLSLMAVGAVMALAFAGSAAPVWVTSTALYGLPLAFLLMLFLILDSVAGRRQAGKSGGR